MNQVIEQRLGSFLFLDGLLLPPEMHTVLRLQAPGLTALASRQGLDSALDPRFAKPLVKTATLLMQERAEVLFAFVGRTEISLLLEQATHRGRRQPWPLAAGAASSASARLSLQLEEAVPFLPSLYQFPNAELVEEYFAWQQELTRQAALVEHYLLSLRQRGVELDLARQEVWQLDGEALEGLLRVNGLEVEEIPAWLRRGTGIYRATEPGGVATLLVEPRLPAGDGLRQLLQRFLG